MAKFINMIALNTGSQKRKMIDEVKGQRYLPMLRLMLTQQGRELPFPMKTYQHLSCEVSIEYGSLLITVRGPKGPYQRGELFTGEMIPLLTFAVERKGKSGIKLWDQLCELAGNNIKRPVAPWCAHTVHETARLLSDEMDSGFMEEFIHGLSCAWIQFRKSELQLGAQ